MDSKTTFVGKMYTSATFQGTGTLAPLPVEDSVKRRRDDRS